MSDIIEIPLIKEDKKEEDDIEYVNSCWFVNKPHRIIISGSSESGKTYFLLKLLPNFNIDELVILSQALEQPVYKSIIHYYEDEIPVYTDTEFNDEYVKLEKKEDEPKKHKVIIIDDLDVDKKQIELIINLFERGRHFGVTVIYVSQDYFKLDKRIRKNANLRIIFKLHDNSIQEISQHCKGLAGGSIKPIQDYYNDIITNFKYTPLMLYEGVNIPRVFQIRAGIDGILNKYIK